MFQVFWNTGSVTMIFSPSTNLQFELLTQDHVLPKSVRSREVKDSQYRFIWRNGISGIRKWALQIHLLPVHDKFCILMFTSNIEFLCGSFTFPARQQWEIALWIICLLDLLLGSLNNFGPKGDKQIKIICPTFMNTEIFIHQSEKNPPNIFL